jgi:nitrogen fixation protein
MDIRYKRSAAGSGRRIKKGDIERNVPEHIGWALIANGWAEEVKPLPKSEPTPAVIERAALVHEGAGWYTLPDGRRIRGKAAAEAALEVR